MSLVLWGVAAAVALAEFIALQLAPEPLPPAARLLTVQQAAKKPPPVPRVPEGLLF